MTPSLTGKGRRVGPDSSDRGPVAPAVAQQLSCALREYRAERGISQRVLAVESGIPQSHLANLEKGQRQPTFQTLARLSSVPGLTFQIIIRAGNVTLNAEPPVRDG